MLMYIFRKNPVLANHLFKVFDAKKTKMKMVMLFLLFVLIWALWSPSGPHYLDSLRSEVSLGGTYQIFEYIIPLVAGLVIWWVFLEDYQNKTYELLAFYNQYKFNYMMFYRWGLYVGMILIGTFISSILFFRHVSFGDITSLGFGLSYLPNILFISSLMLLSLVLTKNNFASLFTILTYIVIDILSDGRVLKFFSIGANINNFYFVVSPQYYMLNRLALVIISIIFVFIACKKSLNLK